MPGIVDRLDAYQRRHRAVGFPLAVLYKYIDDQGPYLAAILTYYTFVAIFPMMLIASSVLGFILQGDPELKRQLLDSALSQFPIVGTQLGRPEGLRGSTSAVVVGAVAATYGMVGLGQAAQNALNVAWAVPRNSRLNPVVSRVHGLLMLTLGGVTVLAVTVLSGLATNLGSLGLGGAVAWAGTLASVAATAVVLSLMMRLTSVRRRSFRSQLPGGTLIAVMWHLLQALGGAYVREVINRAGEMNGVFALVLGLVALIFLASGIAVLGIEVNVVLERRLYPRALLAPFTDAVDLTEADRRAYDSYAKAQRHKGFQTVEVRFEEHPTQAPPLEGRPEGRQSSGAARSVPLRRGP